MEKLKSEWLYMLVDKLLIAAIIAVAAFIFENTINRSLKEFDLYRSHADAIFLQSSLKVKDSAHAYRIAFIRLRNSPNTSEMTLNNIIKITDDMTQNLNSIYYFGTLNKSLIGQDKENWDKFVGKFTEFKSFLTISSKKDFVANLTTYTLLDEKFFWEFDKIITKIVMRQYEEDMQNSKISTKSIIKFMTESYNRR
jgi:hypothetical protein